MARPRKDIDKNLFEKLCGMQCTKEEIAGVLDVSENTVDRWVKRTYKCSFSEVHKQHSAKGKMSLRRAQFKLAEKNAAMAIFLGKQYLGQRDHVEYEDSEAVDILRSILAQNKENAKLQSE